MLGHPLTRRLDIPLAELFLCLEELIDLSSIVSYDESSGEVEIQPTSLVDLLSDKRRSNGFYIDMASTHADFVVLCNGLKGLMVYEVRLYFDP
jgi:hypothetical protein